MPEKRSNSAEAFRLHAGVKNLDFHQKNLLSDEFGVGMAGLLMQQEFAPAESVDFSVALMTPDIFGGLKQRARLQPDYIMWNAGGGARSFLVVECKGSQTTRDTSLKQLCRGLEQVRAVEFDEPSVSSTSYVVATLIEIEHTTIHVLDPPPGEDEVPDGSETSLVRQPKDIRIADMASFTERLWQQRRANLLKWTGQFGSALEIESDLLELSREQTTPLPNIELEHLKIGSDGFVGYRTPFLPELGYRSLKLFVGVQERMFESVREGRAMDPGAYSDIAGHLHALSKRTALPGTSVSVDGTCFAIEGVE